MKRVFWQSQLTGHRGNGSPLPDSIAEAWVRYGNYRYPYITHWTEDTPKLGSARQERRCTIRDLLSRLWQFWDSSPASPFPSSPVVPERSPTTIDASKEMLIADSEMPGRWRAPEYRRCDTITTITVNGQIYTFLKLM